MSDKLPMTADGFAKLKSELETLKNSERPNVIKAIAEAREHGDLSENAEYHAAREKQSFIEGRISELENKISRAEVIDISSLDNSKITFGATVSITDLSSDKKHTYTIVGADESDIEKNLISISAPLGRAMINKTINDLNKHSFISFGRGAPSPVYDPDWALKLGMKDNKKRKPVMKVNSVYGLLLAVQSGVGLAAIPDYLTVKQPNIVKVLPSVEGPITEAHFVYPQSLKNVARVQAFRNFLYSKISEWEF